jgi:hypothetical protein
LTWARVADAGDDVLFAGDAMELMGLLGYRTDGCQQCADRVRRDAAAAVGVFTGFARQLQERRVPPAPPIQVAAATRDAVVGCLRAWRGAPGSPLGPTAIALATAWFWSAEIARLGGELTQPLAAVAVAARLRARRGRGVVRPGSSTGRRGAGSPRPRRRQPAAAATTRPRPPHAAATSPPARLPPSPRRSSRRR